MKHSKVAFMLLILCVSDIRLVLAGPIIGEAVIGVTLAAVAIANSQQCSEVAGCYKGYCWAYCGLSLGSGDWCYTTKTYSQSYEYIRCDDDSQCDKCWKCAGPCSL